ncbi:MAG TPA: LytTR family DNA-binding domain-containing protein [Rhizomicrobium sp.]|nr:LytTR family DNA-binding domain-containing protein [Rhizomicrobium sp.]
MTQLQSPFSVSRMLGIGFLFWLAFLLSLEPDNVIRAMRAGANLDWSRETMRILGASLLGSAATPLLLDLVRRFPVEGAHWRRRVLLHALAGTVIAAGLIFVSCILAGLFLPTEHRPFGSALRGELVSNGPLVAFCVLALIALVHAVRFFERSRPRPVTKPSANYLSDIAVRERGQVTFVDLAHVDWIETQGNYLALHVGSTVHLVRDSLSRLEGRLDPAHFLRVHRRVVVAADRIETVTPLGAGDAQLRLKDGAELRLSRNYRGGIEALLAARK